jgi:hypothetical protein
MTITALITGRLIAAPEARTGSAGKPYVVARLAADADGESVLVNTMAFGSIGQQLMAAADKIEQPGPFVRLAELH